MQLLLKILISGIAVMITSWLLPGVYIEGFTNALLLAALLAFLNAFLKPILVLFTIPITVFTLGLFLLVINAGIILLADNIMDSFVVDSFWWALLFSVILSIVTSIFEGINNMMENR